MSYRTVVLAIGIFQILAMPMFADQIVAWGRNDRGQCDLPAGDDFVAVAGGAYHAIALRLDGSLVQWGAYPCCQEIIDMPEGNPFVAIDASHYHSLALKQDGSIVAWGYNDEGQCDVPGGSYIAIAAGGYHSLAIKSDGSLAAWGDNFYGQCDVPQGNDYIAIAAGFTQGLAIKSDGSLVGWGGGDYYELNNIPPGNNFIAIACGFSHNLALRSNGTLAAWGKSYLGSCDVPEDNDFIAIAADGFYGLAIRTDGTLEYWGGSDYDPGNIPSGDNYTAIAAGDSAAYALMNPPVPLTAIEILGPDQVGENYHAQYAAFAHYADGRTREATDRAFWITDSPNIADVDMNQVLHTQSVIMPETITLHVGYNEDGIFVQDQKVIEVYPSETIRVPQNYPNIQAAVDAARDTDRIIVSDGNYTGEGNYNIRFNGKAINVCSENGPEHCVIDCQKQGRGFTFDSEETEDAVLCGFTINDGKAEKGAGIYAFEASPTIRNCIIQNFIVAADGDNSGWGGGLCLWSSASKVSGCLIRDNSAPYSGGGIYITYAGNMPPQVINCTILSNTASRGGGIYSRGNVIVKNCIIRENTPQQIFEGYGGIDVTFSNIQGGWPGEGNIDADPLFLDAANHNFRLQMNSACIDAADTTVYMDNQNAFDLDGNPRAANDHLTADTGPILEIPFAGSCAVDMGAYEFQPCMLSKKGDLNCDDEVNLLDLTVLAENWLQ